MPYQLIDPDETLDYTFNWSAFLAEAGSPADTIQSANWFVTPPGPLLSNQANDASTATTFISGAAQGQVYVLTNRVVTAAGRTAERSVTLACENR